VLFVYDLLGVELPVEVEMEGRQFVLCGQREEGYEF
jgi:hypothetical protein